MFYLSLQRQNQTEWYLCQLMSLNKKHLLTLSLFALFFEELFAGLKYIICTLYNIYIYIDISLKNMISDIKKWYNKN